MNDQQQNHIDSVRAIMLDQLRALRTATGGDQLHEEIKRSKAVSELSQTIINSAKVEVDYLAVIEGAGDVPFLSSDQGAPKLPAPKADGGPSPFPTSVVHRLKG